MSIIEKYIVKTEKKPTGKNTWDVMTVSIFLKEGETETKIGEYGRNYHSFMNTFCPFVKNGKEYALYSKDYQTTSVMSLPDCKHIADSKPGFCPVDFFVPDFEEFYITKQFYKEEIEKGKDTDNHCSNSLKRMEEEEKLINTRALVAGCVWGDDSGGWKVEMIDISEIENGKISLTDELGYFQLPSTAGNLKDIVRWEDPDDFEIPLSMSFSIDKKNQGFSGYSIADLPFKTNDYFDISITKKEKNVLKK